MKSFWSSYRTLPPKTRVYLGLGGITLALAGHFVSDWLENKIPVDSQQTIDSASSSQIIDTSQKTSLRNDKF